MNRLGRYVRRIHARSRLAALTLILLLAIIPVACSSSSNTSSAANSSGKSAAAGAARGTPAGTARSTPVPATSTPVATPATPVATPAMAVATATGALATPAGLASQTGVTAAIKSVIRRGDLEEAQAFAKHDPTLMRDTATSGYYAQLVQEIKGLASAGITAIQLVDLSWGPIALPSATTAQAATIEIWRTAYANGTTITEPPDLNVYQLVKQKGTWLIQSDDHPDVQRVRPPGTQPSGPTSPSGAPTPPASLGPGQSLNWSGYEATGSLFTAVSGTWTIPTVKAGTNPGANATWVGIGGVSSHDLIQAGTSASVQNGKVTYSAWVEALPQHSQTVSLVVSPGDRVSVTITQPASGRWKIVIGDATTGKSYQTSGQYGSSRSSAEWVEEAPTTGRRLLLPIDNFGTVKFTGATTVEKGKQLTIAQAHGQKITLVNPAGQPLAQPSALGQNGSSFTVTRTSTVAHPVVP